MVRLLRSYLLQHKSVSIPGLGTIYVERIPAQSDFVNRQLLPPAYHFRFDKYFDAPEKEFFSFLAAKKNIPEFEAIKVYNEWAMSMRNSISADQPAILEGVGGLTRDGSGEIIFEPESKLKTYDFPVPAERIIRTNAKHAMLVGDKETTTAEMTGYLQETHKEKTAWWIYALIITAVAVVAVFFHYFIKGSDAPFGNHQKIQTR